MQIFWYFLYVRYDKIENIVRCWLHFEMFSDENVAKRKFQPNYVKLIANQKTPQLDTMKWYS